MQQQSPVCKKYIHTEAGRYLSGVIISPSKPIFSPKRAAPGYKICKKMLKPLKKKKVLACVPRRGEITWPRDEMRQFIIQSRSSDSPRPARMIFSLRQSGGDRYYIRRLHSRSEYHPTKSECNHFRKKMYVINPKRTSQSYNIRLTAVTYPLARDYIPILRIG